MKRKVNCGELPVEITLFGLPHIVKTAGETWPNPRVSSFQEELAWKIDAIPNVNFALASNINNQLRDLYNYLNQNVMPDINTLDGSMLGVT